MVKKGRSYISVFIFAAVILITLLLNTGNCQAAVSKMKIGKWYTVKENTKTRYRKLVLPSDGFVTLYTKRVGKKVNTICDVAITAAPTERALDAELPRLNEIMKKKIKVYKETAFLTKGTYYVRAGSDKIRKYKYRYTFQSVMIPENYTRETAIDLPPSKTVTAYFTKNTNKDRWYRIRLNSKRKLIFRYGYCDSELYDSKGNLLPYTETSGSSRLESLNELEPGTYYIVIVRCDSEDFRNESRYSLDPYLGIPSELSWQ